MGRAHTGAALWAELTATGGGLALAASDRLLRTCSMIRVALATGIAGVEMLTSCLAVGLTPWSAAVGAALGVRRSGPFSAGPVVTLGVLLAKATEAVLAWDTRGFLVGLGVALVAAGRVALPAVPPVLPAAPLKALMDLMTSCRIRTAITFLGLSICFAQAHGLSAVVILFLGLRRCPIRVLSRQMPGCEPNTGTFFASMFLSGAGFGTRAFFSSAQYGSLLQKTAAVLSSSMQAGPALAALGTCSALLPKGTDAEKVAAGAAGTALLALTLAQGPSLEGGALLGIGAAGVAARKQFGGVGGLLGFEGAVAAFVLALAGTLMPVRSILGSAVLNRRRTLQGHRDRVYCPRDSATGHRAGGVTAAGRFLRSGANLHSRRL
ncbi:uncharacterized protein LOC114765931 [Denticeps clupeoides]|uniref:uncharacterized protein LOC114765931 n=1 Tax=Denticeps clupeoides TaxID=299321 RepID=UPI0010A3682E|nr:uncharacterized protein LOC114765931 [Denticeps clupeoides]